VTPWKQIASQASKTHDEKGYSLVDMLSSDFVVKNMPLVNTVPEDKLLKVAGKKITPKDIRTYTWSNRKSRFMTRDRAVVWTYYDQETDTSFVGIGAEVEPKTLERIPNDRIIRGYESENTDG